MATTDPRDALEQQAAPSVARSRRGLRPDFRQRARRIGIDVIATPVRSPRANAIVERVIGTLRRECLDHMIVLDEQHPLSVLAEFVRYYNADRPHRTLGMQTPELKPRLTSGPIRSRVLNGLHHVYERVA